MTEQTADVLEREIFTGLFVRVEENNNRYSIRSSGHSVYFFWLYIPRWVPMCFLWLSSGSSKFTKKNKMKETPFTENQSIWILKKLQFWQLTYVQYYIERQYESTTRKPMRIYKHKCYTSTDWKERTKIKVARRYFIKWKVFFVKINCRKCFL